jgi:arginyl-tRNA--protein-N-Asp/Glu arginylyltransferase
VPKRETYYIRTRIKHEKAAVCGKDSSTQAGYRWCNTLLRAGPLDMKRQCAAARAKSTHFVYNKNVLRQSTQLSRVLMTAHQ